MLIDRIISQDVTNWKDILSQAVCFDVNNVADYLGDKFDFWVNEVPNVAPMFEGMFFEFKSNKEFQEMGDIKNIGVFIGTTETSSEIAIKHKLLDDFKEFNIENARWISYVQCFFEFNTNHITDLDAHYKYLVGYDGKVICANDHAAAICLSKDESQMDNAAVLFPIVMKIPFMSIAFMHCKNVSLEKIEPSQKLNKARVRRGKNPLVKYHIITINPMKKVLDNAGANSSTGLKRAFHICRGHFKDFSDGHGLFGKYQGLYWWDPQVRGKIQNGVMLKDYKVLPDKKGGVNNTPGDMAKFLENKAF